MGDTYYSILKVSSSATQRDIKLAYRKLVQEHHPDVTGNGDEEYIKIINVAYETLSDPIKKTAYDRSLAASYQPTTPNYTSGPTRPSHRNRYRPPTSYKYSQGSTSYIFSRKTQIIGWTATVVVLMLVVVAIMGMHYFASEHYFEEGMEAEHENNPEKALHFYQLAIRDWGGKNVEASIRSAEISKQLGAYYYMVEFCERGLNNDPDSIESARLYYLEAFGYHKSQRFAKAEQAYLKSIQFKFNKDTVYHQLGAIYLNKLAKYSEAEKIYTYLLSANSIDLKDYYNRAICYQYLGEHDKAITDLLLVLEDDPYNGTTLFQLGRSYLALGKTEEACFYLQFSKKQGVNIDPNDLSIACGES